MKIKIIKYYGEYRDEFEYFVAQNITDWEEVDDQTLKILRGWCAEESRNSASYQGRYLILTQPKTSIPQCVSDYLRIIKEKQEAAAARKAKAKQQKLAKLARKKLLAEEQERQLLEDLRKKYGE